MASKKALRRLNYHFNSELQLRHNDTGQAFKFINQAHYEELADAVADYIQDVMVEDYGMIKVGMPLWQHPLNEEHREVEECKYCPIFVTANLEMAETVLVLLCGKGRVASGQWARSLCINDSLKTGSVLPFLDWAKELSFGVVVLNPNKNVIDITEGPYWIPFNETSEAHVVYAWKAICMDLPARHFVLVAHSYGGVSTMNLLKQHGTEVLERLRCIALTDSVHSNDCIKCLSEEAILFLSRHCTNWVSSEYSLDTVIENPPLNQQELKCNQSFGTDSSQFNTAERKKKNYGRCKIASAEHKSKYGCNFHGIMTKIGDRLCHNVSTANENREHDGRFQSDHDAGCSSANCTENAEQEEESGGQFSNSNHLPQFPEQVTTKKMGLNRRTSQGKHTDQFGLEEDASCSGVNSAHDGKLKKNDAYRSSDLNDLPGLSEHATKKRKRANRKTRRKIPDWFGTHASICKVVSAGTDIHEKTTMSAFLSIQTFLLHSLQLAGAAVQAH